MTVPELFIDINYKLAVSTVKGLMYPLPALYFLPVFSLAHLAIISVLLLLLLPPAIPLNLLEGLRLDPT